MMWKTSVLYLKTYLSNGAIYSPCICSSFYGNKMSLIKRSANYIETPLNQNFSKSTTYLPGFGWVI